MAYMRDGFVLIRVPGRELIIDEFDEDSIDVEAAEDKATRRSTTRGKNIFSMMRNVPYEITMSIPPLANSMKRTLEFLKFLKSRDYPELEFEIHEVIDGKSVTSYLVLSL